METTVTLVVDLASAFEKVQLKVVWRCATYYGILQSILPVVCGYFEHQRWVLFEGCVADPLQTITAIIPGPKWTVLLLHTLMRNALSEGSATKFESVRGRHKDSRVGTNNDALETVPNVINRQR